jgi:hypothetical protein
VALRLHSLRDDPLRRDHLLRGVRFRRAARLGGPTRRGGEAVEPDERGRARQGSGESQSVQVGVANCLLFQNQNNGLLQRQLSGKINYGSVDKPAPPQKPQPPAGWTGQEPPQAPPPSVPYVPSSNPFRSGNNPFRQEQVQPEAQDTYMHGTVYDRTY